MGQNKVGNMLKGRPSDRTRLEDGLPEFLPWEADDHSPGLQGLLGVTNWGVNTDEPFEANRLKNQLSDDLKNRPTAG